MTKNIYVLYNRETKLFAGRSCEGQHDGKFVDDVADAKEFPTFGKASEYGQNFGPDWYVEALFPEGPHPVAVMPSDWHRSYRHDY